jgi:hypothetical protein
MGSEGATPEQQAQLEIYRAAQGAASKSQPMLFDLEVDPGETRDLSEAFPEKVRELTERARQLIQEIQEGPTLPTRLTNATGS